MVVEVEVVTVGGRNVPTGGGLGQGGGGSLGAGTPLRAREKKSGSGGDLYSVRRRL